ncbi:hypothetical protein Tco_0459505 [Tanacetum coccineum]
MSTPTFADTHNMVAFLEKPAESDVFHLADADGIDCLPNATIFEELALMGRSSLEKQRKETEVTQDETHHDDSVPIPSNDPLLSGKGCSSKGECWFKEEGLKVRKEKGKSRIRDEKIKESLNHSRDCNPLKIWQVNLELIQAELIEVEKRQGKGRRSNIALIESWENIQAMMEADRLLAERLQTREQDELTNEEMAKLFMEH